MNNEKGPSVAKRAKIISFINLKGGVGKTTICLTMAEIMAFAMDKKILLIDLDSQSNLSSAVVPPETLQAFKKKRASIYHLFLNLLHPERSEQWDIKDAIVKECSNVRNNGNLSVILSLPELGQFDEDLADVLEKGRNSTSSSGVRITVEWRKILKNKLESVSNKYDYIFIDCPPSLSLFTSNALVASDYFVTPIAPEFLSIQGLALIQTRLGRLQQRIGAKNMAVQFAGCVINRVDIRRKDHLSICDERVHRERGLFRPFKYWIGDLKPMYIVTDYYYPFAEKDRKWVDVREKYNYQERSFRNPEGTVLYMPDEGDFYSLYDVLFKLCNEFIGRCK